MKIIEDEEDTDVARAIVDEARTVATSPIAYVEARSAIARRHAQRPAVPARIAAAKRTLETRWSEFAKVPLSEAILADAGEVAERHALRALDALHVASALDVVRSSTDEVVFASWDRDQRRAAQRERLALFPAEL